MPIYAYRCSSCQHEFDVLQKISDAALTVCPQCGQATLAKQLTAAGFQLKGSDWYATDFKNNSPKPAGSGKPAENAPEVKAADKAEPQAAASGDSGGKDSSKDSSKPSTGKDSAKDSGPAKTTPAPSADGGS